LPNAFSSEVLIAIVLAIFGFLIIAAMEKLAKVES